MKAITEIAKSDWEIYVGEDLERMWGRMFQNQGNVPIAMYRNMKRMMTVQVNNVPSVTGTPWEGMLRVGIRIANRRNPRQPKEMKVSWSAIQEIKEQFWPERIAIEVYPRDEEVVDVAPMRWLWVLPKGSGLPFSLSGASDELTS